MSCVGGIGVGLQQADGGHHHARRAVAALERFGFEERLLHRMQAVALARAPSIVVTRLPATRAEAGRCTSARSGRRRAPCRRRSDPRRSRTSMPVRAEVVARTDSRLSPGSPSTSCVLPLIRRAYLGIPRYYTTGNARLKPLELRETGISASRCIETWKPDIWATSSESDQDRESGPGGSHGPVSRHERQFRGLGAFTIAAAITLAVGILADPSLCRPDMNDWSPRGDRGSVAILDGLPFIQVGKRRDHLGGGDRRRLRRSRA